MRSSVRDTIQLIVVATSFFPLRLFYEAVYRLAVLVATLLLGRIDGVVAVYLRRGVARGEVVYGLSDIDLTAVVGDGNGGGQGAKDVVRARYRMLSRLIPLFGGEEEELGAYTSSEFEGLYRDYDHHRYRFSEGRRTWRLLSGEHVLAGLPETPYPDLCLAATEELGRWWQFLVEEIVADSGIPGFRRRYLWHKAIAAAAQVFLFVCHGEIADGRQAALAQAGSRLDGEQASLIDAVRRYPRRLLSADDADADGLLALFLSLACEALSENDRRFRAGPGGKEAVLRVPGPDLREAGSGRERIPRELERLIDAECGPYLRSFALVPKAEFNLDVLRNSDIDTFCLVLVQRSPIPVEKLSKLRSLLEGEAHAKGIEPFIVVGRGHAFSLRTDGPSGWVKSSATCPWFFAMLPENGAARDRTPQETGDSVARCPLPRDFEETIRRRAAKIEAVVSDRGIYKMRALEFLRFFWAAARTRLLLRSLDSDEIRLPLTSGQVLDELAELSPDDTEWLDSLHGEYVKELRGDDSSASRFFQRSVDMLAGL